MSATRNEISVWFDQGIRRKEDFMLVVCDKFDHEDFPHYTNEDDLASALKHYNRDTSHLVMEVYNLREDKTPQLDENRAWNTAASPNSWEQYTSK